jgi:hypothetical protein
MNGYALCNWVARSSSVEPKLWLLRKFAEVERSSAAGNISIRLVC